MRLAWPEVLDPRHAQAGRRAGDGISDLMMVTGDLAEWGLPSKFEQVVEFLTALTGAAHLSRRQVAIVPGNHDVNRKACAAYFQEQKADEHELVAPYWPKWKHFAAAFKPGLCGSMRKSRG